MKAIKQLILHLKDLGDTASIVSECSLGVNLVIDNFIKLLQILHLCINLKAIGRLHNYHIMEILHFKDLGDTELAANAVVLVLGGYQISIAIYLRGGIYPHIKFERDPFFELEL